MSTQNSMNRVTIEEYFSKYDKLIKENLDRWHVPGVSIAVVDGDATYFKVSYHTCNNVSWLLTKPGVWNCKTS